MGKWLMGLIVVDRELVVRGGARRRVGGALVGGVGRKPSRNCTRTRIRE